MQSYLIYLRREFKNFESPRTIKQKAQYSVISDMFCMAIPLSETKLNILYNLMENYGK